MTKSFLYRSRAHRTTLGLLVALVGACAAAFGGGCSSDSASPRMDSAGVVTATGPQATNTNCIEPACQNLPLPPSPHAIRLSHPQWENTVKDLLRLASAPGNSTVFPPDPAPPAEKFGRDASSLVVTNALWKEYQTAAESLGALMIDNLGFLDGILPDAAKSGDPATRIDVFVRDFLPRAYRRPVTDAEIAAMIAHGEKAAASDGTSDPFLIRAKWIISAVLQSPHFLYRVEGGEGAVSKAGRVRLSQYEVAEKLAYGLWGTMPDEKVRAWAASGQLGTNEGVAAAAKIMLADDRATPVLVDFHEQLFGIAGYQGVVRQTSLFPTYYAEFGRDSQEDVRRTVLDLVIKNPGGVKDIYSSTAAYVNAALAGIYGIDPASNPNLTNDPFNFTRVELDKTQRVGILSHAGWLAFQGHTKDPATIQRGAYVARHVLCIPLGSPPPAAAGADPAKSNEATNRKRVEATTHGCGDGCHGGAGGVINPLGFSFEEFDSLGQFRTTDNSIPIDSTGTIEQLGAFKNAAEMLTAVSTNPRTHACYAAHWSAYLNGQTDVLVTPKWLSPVIAKSLAGGSVRDIIIELVQTDAFLTVSR